jgi:hypothetical protein
MSLYAHYQVGQLPSQKSWSIAPVSNWLETCNPEFPGFRSRFHGGHIEALGSEIFGVKYPKQSALFYFGVKRGECFGGICANRHTNPEHTVLQRHGIPPNEWPHYLYEEGGLTNYRSGHCIMLDDDDVHSVEHADTNVGIGEELLAAFRHWLLEQVFVPREFLSLVVAPNAEHLAFKGGGWSIPGAKAIGEVGVRP